MFRQATPTLISEVVYDVTNENIPWYVEVRANPIFVNENTPPEEFANEVIQLMRETIERLLAENGVLRRRNNFNNRMTRNENLDRIAKGLLVFGGPLIRDFFCQPQPYRIFTEGVGTLLDNLQNAIQSNSTVRITDIVFKFIFHENIQWGSGKPRKPSYIDNNCKASWEEQFFQGNKINCGIFAIVQATHTSTGRIDTKRRYLNIENRIAYDFQTSLNFEYNVTKIQLLDWFPQQFPDKRLTIIDAITRNFSHTTVAGRQFVYRPRQISNLVYIVFDMEQNHYGWCQSPKNFMKTLHNSYTRWCHVCVSAYDEETACNCGTTTPKKIVHKPPCKHCGTFGCKPEQCLRTCKNCKASFTGGRNFNLGQGHRCIVYSEIENCDFWQTGDPEDGKKTMLWAYDLESANEACEDMTNEFTSMDGKIHSITSSMVTRRRHIANLLVAKNVFSSERRIYDNPENCIESFILYLNERNKGNHICVAHNGAGYDTRLIFERSAKLLPKKSRNATTNGTKFIEFKIGQIKFRDSLLHLPGSLKKLAKSFELPVQKGYFPHLFNTLENFNYVGPIPDEKYFDLTWSTGSDGDVQKFREWYNHADRQNMVWNFREEIIKYCIDDVEILAQIMHNFHTICFEKFQLSPWKHTTGPAYVHRVIIGLLSNDEKLQLPPVEQAQERHERVQQLARNEHWAALHANEYFFARHALRGGRTDVRCIERELTEEEIARGCRIVYQDMVSMYPAVQMKYDYPVGTPTILIYDDPYYPCITHRNPANGNVASLTCQCPLEEKINRQAGGELEIFTYEPEDQPPEEFLKNFFGFICVTIEPPKNLYHPVLVCWDEDTGKCVGSLERINAQVFTSTEFQIALQEGYKVIRVHRIDHYNKAPGLWRDFIKQLYIEKMANSEPTPELEVQQGLVSAYEEKFEMGDEVQCSFHRWRKDQALRLVYKIMLNSGWGKHCQRPNLPKTTVLNNSNIQQISDYYDNIEAGLFQVTGMQRLGELTYVRSNVCAQKTSLTFHDSYLPAGVFVPSYGRIELYKQLRKLGKRALYHDTDSIIYVYDPAEYNIPTSEILGDWSEEDISKEGIVKFIGIGPKSYGIKTLQGECVKVKGLSLKRCNKDLLNFAKLEQIIQEHKDGVHTPVQIPQMNFQYRMGVGIDTTYNLKQFSFQPETLKGNLHGVYVYPKGYCEQCIIDENHCQ